MELNQIAAEYVEAVRKDEKARFFHTAEQVEAAMQGIIDTRDEDDTTLPRTVAQWLACNELTQDLSRTEPKGDANERSW